jgi:hypothetical protein
MDYNISKLIREINADPNPKAALLLHHYLNRTKGSFFAYTIVDNLNYSLESNQENQWEVEPTCYVLFGKKEVCRCLLNSMELFNITIDEAGGFSHFKNYGVDVFTPLMFKIKDLIKKHEFKEALSKFNGITEEIFPNNNFKLQYFEVVPGEL